MEKITVKKGWQNTPSTSTKKCKKKKDQILKKLNKINKLWTIPACFTQYFFS